MHGWNSGAGIELTSAKLAPCRERAAATRTFVSNTTRTGVALAIFRIYSSTSVALKSVPLSHAPPSPTQADVQAVPLSAAPRQSLGESRNTPAHPPRQE